MQRLRRRILPLRGDFQITLLLKPENFTSLDAFGEC
jgi:hypothetical protein